MKNKTVDVIDFTEFETIAKKILINRKNHESWLNSIENGIKGERRTRKIIGNEFWILDRDVDINGGDLIIQRKNLKGDILSIDPLELGIIQVKFVQKVITPMEIDVKYLFEWDTTEDSLILLEGFFLLVHFDIEDKEAFYCLTSKEIKKMLENKVISSKKILRDNGDIKKLNVVIHVKKLQEYFGVESHNPQEAITKINEELKELDYTKSVSKRFFVGRRPSLETVQKEYEHEGYTQDLYKSIFNIQQEIYDILFQSADFVLYLKDLLRLHPSEVISVYEKDFAHIKLLGDLKERLNKIELKKLEEYFHTLKTQLDSFEDSRTISYVDGMVQCDSTIEVIISQYEELIKEGKYTVVQIWELIREHEVFESIQPNNPAIISQLADFKKRLYIMIKEELESDFMETAELE
ncbi:hypothetical protein H7S55_14735 [Priestia aryabhattai]|uniref:hypothetical protein n=1 Tax=Priestia aryabhattai TaxID=412384 RepID=UPI001C8DCB5F|nr:hypothetical protein [Priestia aryabhattai]MBY0001432.1 hypothetical protein [Priestia aryabhattai]